MILHRWIVVGLLVGSFLSFSGCAKEELTDALGGSGGSCRVVNSDTGFVTCFDFTGSAYAVAGTATTACANQTVGGAVGTYAASACATAGRIGSCQIYAGQAQEQVVRFYDGYIDGTAEAACTGLSGAYTSG
ncbi:MAG: hypothetical protein NDJ90_06155 [Oligoflexia bacterium]|nr:hypothetical protein [Oligoflexia bacterium]